jgi:molybdenum cofactor biosynthesis enzyme MoaA
LNHNTVASSVDTEPGIFICTWDLGRRCNFDCTYCGDDSHDNFSPHANLESLKGSVDFIYSYCSLLLKNRINKKFTISLTGGEPTANPVFPELADYLSSRRKESDLEGDQVENSVTSNGSFSKRVRQSIFENFDGATISYHCDSPKGMREKVIDNILWLHENNFRLKTNIMFHNREDLFQECVDLERFLRERGVRSVPRIVNGFRYTEEQTNWFKDYWNESSLKIENKASSSKAQPQQQTVALKSNSNTTNQKTANTENSRAESTQKNEQSSASKDKFISGRHCCMKIPLSITSRDGDEERSTKYCGDTNFQGWKCGINWKFLHVDQQRDEILHHQTCQANWSKTRGPIGKVSNWRPVIERLASQIESQQFEAIECTLKKCFCGLCAPKAYDMKQFEFLMSKHVKGIRFVAP